ncbi:hypothetical protein, partial [Flavobacterium sp.]|uniref:hypothetical protein n=1 Tax=Flavobacterium sp. TaxID=239 RepID=UPI002CFCEF60
KKLSPTFSTSRWNGILYSKSNQHITLSKVVNNFTMLYIGVAVMGGILCDIVPIMTAYIFTFSFVLGD